MIDKFKVINIKNDCLSISLIEKAGGFNPPFKWWITHHTQTYGNMYVGVKPTYVYTLTIKEDCLSISLIELAGGINPPFKWWITHHTSTYGNMYVGVKPTYVYTLTIENIIYNLKLVNHILLYSII